MSELQALQIMSLPIVPTYPNLFLDNIWSIQFEHGMTTRWRCTSAKISMKGKADWSLCFKIGLVLLVTKTQYPKRPILRTAFTHTWPPCLSSASLPCFGVAESLVGALGHLEKKMSLVLINGCPSPLLLRYSVQENLKLQSPRVEDGMKTYESTLVHNNTS